MERLTFMVFSLFVVFAGTRALAEGTTPPSPQNLVHPCKQIKAACLAAGYVQGGHKMGKGLWKDCIEPIMAGKTVANVNVSAADVQACQARKAELPKKW
jgi:hypothetical protein